MRKAVVFTLGCKVNSCESDSLIKGLTDMGYAVSDNLENADLYIINTCAVTAEAEKKSRQAIARAKKYNPEAEIIVTGCASEKSPEDFLKKENVTLVTGAKFKSKILEMLSAKGKIISGDDSAFDELFPVKSLKTRSYVKIQDGCGNFCSYCIIPYLRGKSRSRKLENIVNEIENSPASEIVLTGINITAYDDFGKRLSDVLYALKDIDKRIRLGSLEEGVIDEKLLETAKNLKNFAPHFHLSLQSGSDKVLRDMNRKYTAAEYLEKCRLIRSYFDNPAITTDVIAGFPTETEKDFEDTLDLMEKAGFSQAHCFSYSARQGTVSYNMPDLDGSVKNQRLLRLLQKAKELKEKYITKNIGNTHDVLFEDYDGLKSGGYSENYIRVYAGGRHEGFKKITLEKVFEDGAYGVLKE